MKELDYPYSSGAVFQRVSWGAIVAGAVTSLALMVCLASLGIGVGLMSAPAAGTLSRAATRFGIGNGAWMIVSGFASFYAGGWIAGRLTGIARVSESVIHGFLSWATATLVAGVLLTTAAAGAFGAAGFPSFRANRPAPAATANVPTSGVIGGPERSVEIARTAGAVSVLGFLLVFVDGVASCYGAKAGTRILRPVPMAEARRERTAA